MYNTEYNTEYELNAKNVDKNTAGAFPDIAASLWQEMSALKVLTHSDVPTKQNAQGPAAAGEKEAEKSPSQTKPKTDLPKQPPQTAVDALQDANPTCAFFVTPGRREFFSNPLRPRVLSIESKFKITDWLKDK